MTSTREPSPKAAARLQPTGVANTSSSDIPAANTDIAGNTASNTASNTATDTVPGIASTADATDHADAPAARTISGTASFDAPPWRALSVVLLGALLATASFFVVNVALPTIARELPASPAQQALIVAAYSAAYAALLVAGGRLGDRFGRRRVFVLGAAGFAVAAGLCALAPEGWSLVAARLLQGAAAGVFAPQVLGSIQALFTGRDRQRAIAYFGAVQGLAAVVGQLIRGATTQVNLAGLGWRTLFLTLLPIAAVTAVLAHRGVPETHGHPLQLDVRGSGQLALTLTALLLPTSLGSSLGWPPWIWALLALCLPCGAWFIRTERRIERVGGAPLLPPSLFGSRAFRRGLLVVLAFFVGVGGFFLTVGLIMQDGLGLEPLETAGVLTPYALGFLCCSLLIPRMVARFGGWVMVTGGVILAGAYLVVMAQALQDYAHLDGTALIPALSVAGFSQGMVMVPVFGLLLGQIPAERAGMAAGVLTTTQQAGLAMGAATMGAVLFAVSEGPPHSTQWGQATTAVFASMAVLALGTSALAYAATVHRPRHHRAPSAAPSSIQ